MPSCVLRCEARRLEDRVRRVAAAVLSSLTSAFGAARCTSGPPSSLLLKDRENRDRIESESTLECEQTRCEACESVVT